MTIINCIHCNEKFNKWDAPDLYDELSSQTNKKYKRQYKFQKEIQHTLNLNIITCPSCSKVIIYRFGGVPNVVINNKTNK